MNWKTKRFLWFPLLGFALLFALDKVFMLPSVLHHTMHFQKIEPIFYESRGPLFEQLRAEYNRRSPADRSRLALIFGSSRAAEFDHEYIARRSGGVAAYNFSAPFASPAFHYYWLQKILAAGIRPAFAIIEADPLILGGDSMEYTLKYSLDANFVVGHTDLFRRDPSDIWMIEGRGFSYPEAEDYFLLRAFALYRYPLVPSTLLENNKQIWALPPGGMIPQLMPARDSRLRFREFVQLANELKLGGIPNPLSRRLDEREMQNDAEDRAKRLFSNYRISGTQIIFLKHIIRELLSRQTRVIVYWPVSAAAFQKHMLQQKMPQRVEIPLRALLRRLQSEQPGADIRFVDPNDDQRLRCRDFIDSHHLSGACFPQLTDLVLSAQAP
ncbi:MAG: DUF1574 domain-containing protein [Leptospirales bacterium]|nr:DUF1574 domain-containing protein [Leptospirales bacterium]